jgi:hypothetical protein
MQLLIDKKYRTIYFKNNLVFYKSNKGNIDASEYFKKTGELKKIYNNLLKSENVDNVIKNNIVDKKHESGLTHKSLNSSKKIIKGGENINIDAINIDLLKNTEINFMKKESILKTYYALLTTLYIFLISIYNFNYKKDDIIDNTTNINFFKMTVIYEFIFDKQNFITDDEKYKDEKKKVYDNKAFKNKSFINNNDNIYNLLNTINNLLAWLILQIHYENITSYNSQIRDNLITVLKEINKIDSFDKNLTSARVKNIGKDYYRPVINGTQQKTFYF